MNEPITGIHHITAIASDPQTNVDFYLDVLGLRLVKRTVNYDDPGTYHLYYGDGEGRPGTIMTFFPWPGARRGVPGVGQVAATAFAVPEGSLGFWHHRLRAMQLPVEAPADRFGEAVLTVLDPDGLRLELVARAGVDARPPWTGGGVGAAHAIRGFAGVALRLREPRDTARLLTETMGLATGAEDGARLRLHAGAGDARAHIDLLADPEGAFGRLAAGSIHHVAWRAADQAQQLRWRQALIDAGQSVTPVIDRNYFRSVYFREPGGVLFELATDPPGFTVDETVASLGRGLALPPWLEPERAAIASRLPPLTVGAEAGGAAAAETGAS